MSSALEVPYQNFIIISAEDLGIDGKIVLESSLGKQGGMLWTRFILVRIVGTSGMFF
jgi:hypothetical protein